MQMRKTNAHCSVCFGAYNLSYVDCVRRRLRQPATDDRWWGAATHSVRKREQRENDKKNVLIWGDLLISIVLVCLRLRHPTKLIYERNEWKCSFSFWKSGTSLIAHVHHSFWCDNRVLRHTRNPFLRWNDRSQRRVTRTQTPTKWNQWIKWQATIFNHSGWLWDAVAARRQHLCVCVCVRSVRHIFMALISGSLCDSNFVRMEAIERQRKRSTKLAIYYIILKWHNSVVTIITPTSPEHWRMRQECGDVNAVERQTIASTFTDRIQLISLWQKLMKWMAAQRVPFYQLNSCFRSTPMPHTCVTINWLWLMWRNGRNIAEN